MPRTGPRVLCVCARSVSAHLLALGIAWMGEHITPHFPQTILQARPLTLPAGQSSLPGHCDSSPDQQHITVKLLIFQILRH